MSTTFRVLLACGALLLAFVTAIAVSVLGMVALLFMASGSGFVAVMLMQKLFGLLPEAMILLGSCGILCAGALFRSGLIPESARGRRW